MFKYRIFGLFSNPVDGTHWHLVASGQTWKTALSELRKRDAYYRLNGGTARQYSVSIDADAGKPLITA